MSDDEAKSQLARARWAKIRNAVRFDEYLHLAQTQEDLLHSSSSLAQDIEVHLRLPATEYFQWVFHRPRTTDRDLEVFRQLVERRAAIFRSISKDAARAVCAKITLRAFDPRQPICEQGDSVDAYYFIVDGSAKAFVRRMRSGDDNNKGDGDDAEESETEDQQVDALEDPDYGKCVSTIPAGKGFGELGFFTGEKRNATVLADTEHGCTTLCISKTDYIQHFFTVHRKSMRISSKYKFLKETGWFPGWSRPRLVQACYTLVEDNVEPRTVLGRWGQGIDYVYICREGRVTIHLDVTSSGALSSGVDSDGGGDGGSGGSAGDRTTSGSRRGGGARGSGGRGSERSLDLSRHTVHIAELGSQEAMGFEGLYCAAVRDGRDRGMITTSSGERQHTHNIFTLTAATPCRIYRIRRADFLSMVSGSKRCSQIFREVALRRKQWCEVCVQATLAHPDIQLSTARLRGFGFLMSGGATEVLMTADPQRAQKEGKRRRSTFYAQIKDVRELQTAAFKLEASGAATKKPQETIDALHSAIEAADQATAFAMDSGLEKEAVLAQKMAADVRKVEARVVYDAAIRTAENALSAAQARGSKDEFKEAEK